jgi:hypothetical protein
MATYEETSTFIAETALAALVNEVTRFMVEGLVVAEDVHHVPFIGGRLRRAGSVVIVRTE